VSTARRVPNADAEPEEPAVTAVRGSRGRLSAGIVAAILIVDQASKAWAVANLADGPKSIIGTDVQLHLTFNSGGAFSLFRGFTPLLALLAIVIAVVLVRAVRRTDDVWTLVALGLVLGGALGNLIDRVFRAPRFLSGRVVDFISVGSFPTFNVADSAITVGAVLMLVLAFVPRRSTA
jgi:signal peptidase II